MPEGIDSTHLVPPLFDGHQLWTLVSLPDNVPIVLMMVLLAFYLWLGFRQARANDRLIGQLEKDPDLAKTHHRKTFPWHPKWDKTVSVWPHLLKREFLAAVCGRPAGLCGLVARSLSGLRCL